MHPIRPLLPLVLVMPSILHNNLYTSDVTEMGCYKTLEVMLLSRPNSPNDCFKQRTEKRQAASLYQEDSHQAGVGAHNDENVCNDHIKV